MKRLICALLLGAFMASAAAADAINRGTAADPPTLDPTLGTASIASAILSDMVDGLVIRGSRGQPVPGVAASWDISDDGLRYTFRLREGLRWSDGMALTADDFVYSFRRILDPQTRASAAGLFFIVRGGRAAFTGQAPVEDIGVSAPDARTVVIELAQPAPYFISLLANTQAFPVPRHAIEKHGRDWVRPGIMVTNGPYVLAERVPQDFIRLDRNPHYHERDEVAIDTVYWRPTQDLGTAFRRFRAGELDVVLQAPPDKLDWIRENIPGALHQNPVQAVYYLMFNTAVDGLGDARVRRALSLAIDRDGLTGQLLADGARPAASFVTPGTGGYPGYTPPEYALPFAERQALARRLLAEAGHGPGNPLRVPVLYDTQEENRKIMIAITSMWRAVGVEADASNTEFRAVLRRMRTGDFAIARAATFALFDDPYAFLQQLESRNPRNLSGWREPRYDALLAQANASGNGAQRMRLMAEAEALMLEGQPLIPVFWYMSKLLVAERVNGWHDAPLGQPQSRYLSLSGD